MASLQDRMIRAAKLDVQLYEEVEADQGAMAQAMTVVILSALAAGIGSANVGPLGLVLSMIGALIGRYAWAFLTYLIGTKLLPEPETRADYKELLRTIGFSSAPGLIRVLGIIPGLRALLFTVASIWMLVAMVIAVRQALDYTSTGPCDWCLRDRLGGSDPYSHGCHFDNFPGSVTSDAQNSVV